MTQSKSPDGMTIYESTDSTAAQELFHSIKAPYADRTRQAQHGKQFSVGHWDHSRLGA